MEDAAATNLVGMVCNQLLHSSPPSCINDDDTGNLVAGTKENIQDMVKWEEESLIRNANQEEVVVADVRPLDNSPKIDLMLHHTTSPLSTQPPVNKKVILLLLHQANYDTYLYVY